MHITSSLDVISLLLDAVFSRTARMQHNAAAMRHRTPATTTNTTNTPTDKHIKGSTDHDINTESVDIMLGKLAANNGAGHSTKTTAGLWWTAALFIVINHIVVMYALLYYPVQHTSIWYATALHAWLHLTGVTAGYHRLWSHRSYTAHWTLRTFLAVTGLMSFQGSARWWALRHRLHHRFTDTNLDPYNARRGLFYSHIGWLFEPPQQYTRFNIVNARDLDHDMVCVYQKKYLLYGYILFGALYPSVLGWWLCGDWVAGLIYIGGLARIFSWHSIFSVNSLSHWKGDKKYNRHNTAVSNHLIGILQNGEGYHNFHHEFPGDYRSGVKYTDVDITKWFIYAWHMLGLVSEMKYVSDNEILKTELDVQQELLDEQKQAVVYPPDDINLKTMTMDDVRQQVSEDKSKVWIVLDGYVLDISEFKNHPGGDVYLKAFNGKDASTAFHKSVNEHTHSATNYAAMFRIAKLVQ